MQKGEIGSCRNRRELLSIEETQFPTNVVITADVFSRYVFWSDVAYDSDSNVSMGDIVLNTTLFKEDHLSVLYLRII